MPATQAPQTIHEVQNPSLLSAITKLQGGQDQGSAGNFFQALFGSTLIVPINVQQQPRPDGTMGQQIVPVLLRSPQGGTLFPVFTDANSYLTFDSRGMSCIIAPFGQIARTFLQTNAPVLFVNPGTPYAAQVTQQQVRQILERLAAVRMAAQRQAQQTPPQPELPASIQSAFQSLIANVPVKALDKLRKQVDDMAKQVDSPKSSYGPVEKEVVKQLASRSQVLLSQWSSRPEPEQALIVGAVRYFVNEDDAFPDNTPHVGFDDDVMVMNFVLNQLGLGNQAITR